MDDFERELAKRNPDWEKIVAVHKTALGLERQRLDRMSEMYFEASVQFTDLLNALRKISSNHCKHCDCQEDSKAIADAALAKLEKK